MEHRPKYKNKTINLLKRNQRENLDQLGLGKEFLDMIPKSQSIKEKLKLGFTKIEFVLVYASEDSIKRMKKTKHRLRENVCTKIIQKDVYS